MVNYKIKIDDDSVSICASDNCTYKEGFIDIFVDSELIRSPFENVDDAKLFAEIIVKLLRCVQNDFIG